MRSLLIQSVVVTAPPLIVYAVTGALWPAALLALALALTVSLVITLRVIRQRPPGARRVLPTALMLAAISIAVLPWFWSTRQFTGDLGEATALNRRMAFHHFVLQQLDRHYHLPQMFAYCARRQREHREPFAAAARRFLEDRKVIGGAAAGRMLEEEILPSPDTEILLRFRGRTWGDVSGTPPRLVPFSPQPAALVHIDAMGVRYAVEQ